MVDESSPHKIHREGARFKRNPAKTMTEGMEKARQRFYTCRAQNLTDSGASAYLLVMWMV
jgi:hypothetical protein